MAELIGPYLNCKQNRQDMELLYLWIEDYGVFKKQGINFGGQYLFELDFEAMTLQVHENPHYIENFFSNSPIFNSKSGSANSKSFPKISTVTAIVGENGVGKSTLLDFIKEALGQEESFLLRESIVVYRGEAGKVRIYYPDSWETELQLKIGDDVKADADQFESPCVFSQEVQTNFAKNTDMSIVFYSSVFDFREEYTTYSVHNISTNYLVRQDRRKRIELGTSTISGSEITLHNVEETERQIRFFCEFMKYNDKQLPFSLPRVVKVYPASVQNRRVSKQKKAFLEAIFQKFENSHFSYEEQLYRAVLNSFFTELENVYDEESKLKIEQFLNQKEIFTEAELLSKFGGPNDPITQKIIRFFTEIALFHKQAKGIMNVLMMFDELASQYYEHWHPWDRNRHGEYLQLSLDGEGYANLKKFYDYYKTSFLNIPFLNFEWSELSSGQKALLNTYSRFYSLADSQLLNENEKLRKNLLVLIDEGELYLHPQWQKQFLQIVIDFLPQIYKREDGVQRNIQLIVTSNSPFVASDLPNSNVIFLREGESTQRTVLVEGLEEKKQTFAANIHTLFADSFFIREGVVGDFAKNRINEIVHLLLHGEVEVLLKHEKQIDRFIRMIGEPLVKNKLLNILEQRLKVRMLGVNREFAQVYEKISKLEKEILRLKGQVNDDSNQ